MSQKDFSLSYSNIILRHKLADALYFVPKHDTETRLAIRLFRPLEKRWLLEWLLAALYMARQERGNTWLKARSYLANET